MSRGRQAVALLGVLALQVLLLRGYTTFRTTWHFLLHSAVGFAVGLALAALVTALRDPQVRERMILAGHAPVQGENTLETTRAYMERELGVMREMVERTGIRLQP